MKNVALGSGVLRIDSAFTEDNTVRADIACRYTNSVKELFEHQCRCRFTLSTCDSNGYQLTGWVTIQLAGKECESTSGVLGENDRCITRQVVGSIFANENSATSLIGTACENMTVGDESSDAHEYLVGIFGILLYMGKSEKKKGIGTIMLGFMALMTGMDLMSSSMSFLKSEAWFADLMISFTNPIVGILFGAVLTAVIQSSSASIGILQGLCSTGVVTYGAAIPIILGQNIGTCITAIMGAIGANRNARRTAMVHLLFNVVGATRIIHIMHDIEARECAVLLSVGQRL